MQLPIFLSPGQVLIYGFGSTASVSGIVPSSTGFLFGVIQQVWNYGNINAQVGTSVMFNDKDVICRLAVSNANNWPYTLIEEAKLVLTENIIVPP